MRKIKLEYDRIYPDKKKIACLTCLKLAIFIRGGGVKLEFNDYLVLPRFYENVVKNCTVDSLK